MDLVESGRTVAGVARAVGISEAKHSMSSLRS